MSNQEMLILNAENLGLVVTFWGDDLGEGIEPNEDDLMVSISLGADKLLPSQVIFQGTISRGHAFLSGYGTAADEARKRDQVTRMQCANQYRIKEGS